MTRIPSAAVSVALATALATALASCSHPVKNLVDVDRPAVRRALLGAITR